MFSHNKFCIVSVASDVNVCDVSFCPFAALGNIPGFAVCCIKSLRVFCRCQGVSMASGMWDKPFGDSFGQEFICCCAMGGLQEVLLSSLLFLSLPIFTNPVKKPNPIHFWANIFWVLSYWCWVLSQITTFFTPLFCFPRPTIFLCDLLFFTFKDLLM